MGAVVHHGRIDTAVLADFLLKFQAACQQLIQVLDVVAGLNKRMLVLVLLLPSDILRLGAVKRARARNAEFGTMRFDSRFAEG